MYTMYAPHTESLSESSEDGGVDRGKKASGKVGEDMEVDRNTPTVHLKGMLVYTCILCGITWEDLCWKIISLHIITCVLCYL